MGRLWVLAPPLALLLLFVADRAAERSIRHQAHTAFGDPQPRGRAPAFALLPALRGFLVQVWLLRIDAALRAGEPTKALRHAREALAVAPDMPAARVRLADVLAYNLPPRELDPARRLAWIAEGLAILDEGLARDPYDALLHTERGFLIRSRGEVFPEFEEAFRATYGRSTLAAGVDAQVQGAQFARGDVRPVRAASLGLLTRATDHLAAAEAGERERLQAAQEDFALAEEFLRELLAWSRLAPDALAEDLELARAGRRLAELLAGDADRERVTAARERFAELLAAR